MKLLILLFLCVLPGRDAAAAGDGKIRDDLEIEARLVYPQLIANCWTPVQVTLTNNGKGDRQFEVWLGFGSDVENPDFRSYLPVALPAGSAKQVTLYGVPRAFGNSGSVWVKENGRKVGRTLCLQQALTAEGPVMLVVGREPGQLARLSGLTFNAPRLFGGVGQVPLALVDSPSQVPPECLPDRWIGYQTCDFVLLQDAVVTEWRPAQRQALLQWVLLGGSVGVAMGDDWHWYLDPYIQELLGSTEIEPAQYALPMTESANLSLSTYIIHSPEFRGRYMGDTVAVRNLGKGRVWFIGFDAGDVNFVRPEKSSGLWRDILRETPPSRPRSLRVQGEFREVRVDRDLADLLNASVLPSFWLIAGLMVVYLVIVGPVNFILLHRYRLQPYLIFSVPLISLAFVGFIFLGGYASNGLATLSRDLARIELVPGTNYLHGVKYVALKPSTASTFSLDLDENSVGFPIFPEDQSLLRSPTTIRLGPTFGIEDFNLEIWESGYVRIESLIPDCGSVRVRREASDLQVENQSVWNFSACSAWGEEGLWTSSGRVSPGEHTVLALQPQTGNYDNLAASLNLIKKSVAARFLEREAKIGPRGGLVARVEEDPIPVKISRRTFPEVKETFLILENLQVSARHD